jgi:phosphonate transport system substrate-binding protein
MNKIFAFFACFNLCVLCVNKRPRHTINLICSFIFLTLLSCNERQDANSKETPSKLIIGVLPGDDPEETMNRMEPIARYLEKQLGIPVKVFKSTDYTGVIEAIRAKKVHIAYLSGFPYVLASKRANIEPLVAMGKDGKPRASYSLIITHRNSGIKTMEDVKARAKDLTLAFSDPASTSGHLMPRAYLTSIGLNPESSFKEVMFASSNAASIFTVKAQKVDLGCTYFTGLEKQIKKGNIKREDIVVVWKSEEIMGATVVIRKDIDKDFALKIQNAYLALPTNEPQTWTQYKVKSNIIDDDMVYVKSADSLYNGLRKLAGRIGDYKITE